MLPSVLDSVLYISVYLHFVHVRVVYFLFWILKNFENTRAGKLICFKLLVTVFRALPVLMLHD